MDNFVHLHCSSNFSLLYGGSPLEALVRRCAELGMDSIAVTDRDGLYGAVPFFECAEKAGIKAIIGLDLEVSTGGEGNEPSRLVLLARDAAGYSNLCRLATERHLGADRSSVNGAPVPPDSLPGCSGGLVALCRDARMLAPLRDVFGGSLYAELVNDGTRACHREAEALIDAALGLGVECVATNAAAFASPEEHRLHLVVNAIRLICPVTRIPAGEAAGPQMYIKSGAQMREAFSCHPYSKVPQAVSRVREIAEMCNFRFTLNRRLFPAPDLPRGETAFSHLMKLCFEGAARRYRPLTGQALRRLHHELDTIEGLGFTPYFLAVNDITTFCREHGIPAAARGSAAGSMVAYILGITYIDPLEHDLYFERFLSPAREDPPDIDLDVSWCRRDEVLDYIYERFGHDRVAMICAYATMKPRMAVRDVSKALGLPPDEVDEFAGNVPRWCKGSIEEAAAGIPSCRDLPSGREPYRTILELCAKLDGFPRHLSVHAGGIVIAEGPLTEIVPLERAARGLIITQYDMGPIEKLGLVKMDILGQKGLSVIEDTARWAAASRGSAIDIDHLPRDDPDTFRLLREGRTLGVFQIESPGMRSLLKSMKPRSVEDITLSIALIRPGASGSGMKELFLLRRAGLEPVVYLHPDLEPILSESLGAFIYQEQVMKAAVALAGFSPAGADDLRRAMTKKRAPGQMASIKERFVSRAVSRGVPPAAALAVFESLAKFAGYGFSKAHAATYGEFSYQAAYLKAHHPAEFMAAVLCNEGGFYHHSVYVEEARRLGVLVALPDINRSEADYRVVGGALLFGLLRVKGISHNTVASMLEARQSFPFTSLSDFLSRVDAEEGEVESLIKCGAFDSLENTRPELLWKLAMMYPRSRRPRRRAECAELPLDVNKVGPALALPRLPDYDTSQKLAMELSYLEASVSCHPLEVVAPREVASGEVASTDLEGRAGQTVTLVGWLIARRRAVTRKSEYMQFLTLEDLSGTFEVILFPEAYQRLGAIIAGARALRVTGKVKDRAGSVSLIASDIEPLA